MKLDFSNDPPPSGTVILPPSKSIANRLLILQALTGNELSPHQPNEASDTRILRTLLQNGNNYYNVGMAGTTGRFLTAYLALQPGTHELTGDRRMLERPIKPLVEALRQLGGDVDYVEKEGFLPLRIKGCSMEGGSVKIPGDISSQFLSAILMISPYLKKGIQMEIVGELFSAPYLNMTIQLMRQSGAIVRAESDFISVQPGAYRNVPPRVESDWSAAAFFYELVALCKGGTLQLPGLRENSLQGDAASIRIFEKLGVKTSFDEHGARIDFHGGFERPERVNLNCRNFPDLVQPLICTLAGLKILACFSGVKSLRIKETDRLAALQIELAKIGTELLLSDDTIELVGFTEQKNNAIETWNDHRMAMAFAPLAAVYPGMIIQNPKVVGKSFPDFWNQLHGVISTGISD